MRQAHNIILLMIVLLLAGCTKPESPNKPPAPSNELSEYLPIKIGNAWTYYASTIPLNGEINIQNASTSVLSVRYTKVLVGGQPNAFILRAEDESGNKQNLSFYMDRNTLYHYLGVSNTLILPNSFVPWLSGSVAGVRVGLNESKKFKIDDYSGTRKTYSIKEIPDNTIASASIISPDTILLHGFQNGNTTLVLKKEGGEANDTMTVIVQVTPNTGTLFPLPTSWLPIWLMTTSTDGENIFNWDTTYSFKLYKDSSRFTDRIRYNINNRFIGNENVVALGGDLNCEKYELKISVYEQVKLNDTLAFDGLSSDLTALIWMAKGIGFVKGKTYGSTRSFYVLINGAIDSSGILHGAFVSPRVSYAVIEMPPAYIQTFDINKDPLEQAQTASAFLLRAKNF